jgi:hypothetical protein
VKIFWVVIVAAVAVGVYYASDRIAERRVDAARAQFEVQARVRQIIDDLKYPPEAIYQDPDDSGKINRIRFDAYVAHGTKAFIPYANQAHPGSLGDVRGVPDQPGEAGPNYVRLIGGGDSAQVANSSYENYLLNFAPERCGAVTEAFESGGPVGDYLRAHRKDVYEKEIEWRLLAMAESWNDYMAIPACRALVAAGDRSGKLKYRLQQIAKRTNSSGNPEKARRLLEQCGFEVPSTSPASAPSTAPAP